MTDAKQNRAESLLAELHKSLWGSKCVESMSREQVFLMDEVAAFVRQDNAVLPSGEDLVKVHVSNIGIEGRHNPGEHPISTDETVLLRDRMFYAMSPLAERPFVTVIAQHGLVSVLFPRGVPDEFKELVAERLKSFVNEKVNEPMLAVIKACILDFWQKEIFAGRIAYLHCEKEWRMSPA